MLSFTLSKKISVHLSFFGYALIAVYTAEKVCGCSAATRLSGGSQLQHRQCVIFDVKKYWNSTPRTVSTAQETRSAQAVALDDKKALGISCHNAQNKERIST